MEKKIILNEQDIAQVIANTFDCDVKNVQVIGQVQYEGVGPMEHPVTRCKAIITITQEVKHTHA